MADRFGAKSNSSANRSSSSAGRPARGGQDRPTDFRNTAPRETHDDPDIPDSISAKDLDASARNQLKTLSAENAETVARHLAAAAKNIESDPELAHAHAKAAARTAGRIALAHETLAITAYTTGDYALALRELRTYRRISGKNDQLPLMVDSERGLGRPDKALELGRSVSAATLPPEVQAHLSIAMSGARLDLGQLDAALTELHATHPSSEVAHAWSADLFSALANVHADLGNDAEASIWDAAALRADAAHGAMDDDDSETMEILEEELPIAEQVLPAAEKELPTAEERLPVAEDELPVAEDELPVAEDELPVAADELPADDENGESAPAR